MTFTERIIPIVCALVFFFLIYNWFRFGQGGMENIATAFIAELFHWIKKVTYQALVLIWAAIELTTPFIALIVALIA